MSEIRKKNYKRGTSSETAITVSTNGSNHVANHAAKNDNMPIDPQKIDCEDPKQTFHHGNDKDVSSVVLEIQQKEERRAHKKLGQFMEPPLQTYTSSSYRGLPPWLATLISVVLLALIVGAIRELVKIQIWHEDIEEQVQEKEDELLGYLEGDKFQRHQDMP